MPLRIVVAVALAGGVSVATAAGRDDPIRFPIQAALEKSQSYKTVIDYDIRLFWGAQKTPAVERRLGEFTFSKKTNAFNKSDQEACDIAFISAVAALQERARSEGGNAVVNIRSVHGGDDTGSGSEYVCRAGTIMAGVALRGTIVRLK